jgi:FkbM family methyltransferase
MKMTRKEFLMGAAGVAAGVPAGALGWRYRSHLRTASAPSPTADPDQDHGTVSYAQAGEDVMVAWLLEHLKIGNVTYLDVGAYEPITLNNTYLFYRRGCRGVLLEPNVTLCEKLRQVRPRDTVLAAGIGVTAAREADYYVMSEPSWNTFSKEQAEQQEKNSKGKVFLKEVIKLPLLNINDVIEEHFPQAPTFLSIDTEGLDLPILKSLNFTRFHPQVVCVETLSLRSPARAAEVTEFLSSQGYVVAGMTYPNTIYLDRQAL